MHNLNIHSKATQRNRNEFKRMASKNVVHTLREVPLLSQCTKSQLTDLAIRMTKRRYKPNDHLMREGDEGSEFFIIAKGTCSVLIAQPDLPKPKCIAQLHVGDYCGEQALLSSNPRSATITADTEVIALVITRDVFQQLIQNGITFAKRKAVCAEDLNVSVAESKSAAEDAELSASAQDRVKSPIERKWIWYTVSGNILFAQLTPKQKSAVIECMYKKKIKRGDYLIREGERGDLFYVIRSGKFEIKSKTQGLLKLLCPGDCCGELALLYGAPRAASVQAISDAIVWCVHRAHLRKAIMNEASKERNKHIAFLKKVPLLSSLLTAEVTAIDDALEEETFQAGDVIIKQGDKGDKFYIIKEGKAQVIKHDQLKQVAHGALSTGDYFGERALLKNDTRAATIVADSPQITLLSLTREKFNYLLGSLEDLMQRNMEQYKANLKLLIENRRQMSLERANSLKFGALEDLEILGLLGRGGYGLVKLVRDHQNHHTFALKEVRKDKVISSNQTKHINDERSLMMQMDSPFLVRLWRTYQDEHKVYFLVDVCLGGDLFTILRKSHSFKEHVARFYAGCVVEGFEHLHGMNMVFRDLKPENLVLDKSGYVKITDFGFCKTLDETGKTFTLCGTPDYLAPEIIRGGGHGVGVDYWTLGILLYEMLGSMPPFYDRDPTNIYRKICRSEPSFPAYFSNSAKDIIRKLLRKRATERLGCIAGGIRTIKKQAWFKGFDWKKLQKQEMKVPYKPRVKSETEISNFRCKVVHEKPFKKIVDQSPFKDF
eukprot:236565_1